MKKHNKLHSLLNEVKQTHFRQWKKGKHWLFTGLVLTGLAGGAIGVHALSTPTSGGTVNYSVSGTGTAKWSNGENTSANFLTINGQTVFCINPFVDVKEGALATQSGQAEAAYQLWNQMTPYQQNLINNIAYVGLVDNGGNDKNINFATQLSMWMVQSGQTSISGTSIKNDSINQTQLKNVLGGKTLTGWSSTGADVAGTEKDANIILEQAVKMLQTPDFNPNPLRVVVGKSAVTTDKNGVLSGQTIGTNGLTIKPFNNIKPSEGLTATAKGNDLTVNATVGAIGKEGKIDLWNTINPDARPHFIYGTVNPDRTVGQELFSTSDPARLFADLKVNVIGLGSTTLTKQDSDTNSATTQGKGRLDGSIWGLYYKGTNDLVKRSDAQDGYPITVTSGTSLDNDVIKIKMNSDLKVGLKNLAFLKDTEWGELSAPSGYAKTTKRIPVHFDEKDKFDEATDNFVEDVTAKDDVAVFNFMFTKVQDVNGSLTGLNGAEFTLTPQKGTAGKPIVVTSGTGVDTNGYTVNGLTIFDGKANLSAGNLNKNGIAGGDYLLTESKVPDGTKAINPISVSFAPNLNADGSVKSYTTVIKDTVTHQVITSVNTDANTLVDNNLMFKVNLGSLTDKAVETPKPTITTTATDKSDGDKMLGVGKVQVTDKSIITGLKPNTAYTLDGQVVYKGSGEAVKDDSGKNLMTSKAFTTDKDGNATVILDFPQFTSTKDQDKEYTVLETVRDQSGKTAVEEKDYKNNPSQSVKVDNVDGHTEVQTKDVEIGKIAITDKYFYKGLVKGDTYTVKISQAYDHQLKKVIPVEGSITFTATASSGTVDIPVKVDTTQYVGHELTFYEDLYHGKDTGKKPIKSNHNPDDKKETVKVKTPQTPNQPKGNFPKTGENNNAWLTYGGALLLTLAAGGTVYYYKKNKKQSE